METEYLKRIYKEAAEIAKVVPEAMQEAAFNRALDSLLGGKVPSTKGREGQSRARRQDGQPVTVVDTKARVAKVLESVNRTKYPDVSPEKNVLPNALWILHAAKDDCEIDGLTANEIGKILTDKFRVKTSGAAVRMALGSASDKVDRVAEGTGYLYRIMQPGEDYLETSEGDHKRSGKRIRKQRPEGHNRGATPRNESSSSEPPAEPHVGPSRSEPRHNDETPGATPNKSRKVASRPGPMEAVEDLITAQFFSSPRKISDIQAHLEQRRGHRYKVTDLSPTLVRLLRAGKLDRERDDAGQYEYRSH